MVFSFGIGNTLQRYMPEYYNRGEFVLANRLYQRASSIRLLSNIITLGLIFYFWETVTPLLKVTAYKNYFVLFSVVILLNMQRGILENCLASYFLQKFSQGLSIIFVLIKGVGYGLALLFQWDLWAVLIIDLLASLVVFLLLQWVYWVKVPRQGGLQDRFSKEERRRLARYAFYYNFNDVGVGMLDANFDTFIIAMFLDPIAVGAYAFCHRINNMASRMLPVNYLLDVVRPLFIAGNHDGQSAEIQRNFQLLLKITYLFQFPLFVFFLLLSKDLITVFFGGKFIEFSPLIIAVACCNLVNAFQLPVGLVAQLRERAEVILYSKIFALYNLLADLVFIHYWGIWGAVLATGSAVLFRNLFIWFYVRHEAGFSGTGLFFARSIVGWLVVIGIGSALGLLTTNALLRLVAGAVLIVAAFILHVRHIHFNQWEQDTLCKLANVNKKIQLFFKSFGLSAIMSAKQE